MDDLQDKILDKQLSLRQALKIIVDEYEEKLKDKLNLEPPKSGQDLEESVLKSYQYDSPRSKFSMQVTQQHLMLSDGDNEAYTENQVV